MSKAAEEDESMGEFWRDVNAARQAKRADNRKYSTQILAEAGIRFESKNCGAHLIVTAPGHTLDFWPGTGLWRIRGSTKSHRGVRRLIGFCTLTRKGQQ